ncbi:MAG: S1C family serine protease [Myxococcaceae bacterium]
MSLALTLLMCLAASESPPVATEPLWRARQGGIELKGFSPPQSLAPLVKAVQASVVHIEAARTDRKALGSGFVLTPDGWALTNAHVVGPADSVRVRLLDGRRLNARVVGKDGTTDLALLALELPDPRPLPHTILGDSDALEVGDWVVAIGNPFGLSHSVSHGIVSAKARALGLSSLDDFLQTDVSLNPGNSGGPLFNLRGEVVGVSTAQLKGGQGVGFAVPINLVKALLEQLRLNGRVVRGWLGLTAFDDEGGILVREVAALGPSQKAGVRVGDRIVAAQGRAVQTYAELVRRLALLGPGTKVHLGIRRGESAIALEVHLGERPK